jgi:outer membrane protein assembly factor BamC
MRDGRHRWLEVAVEPEQVWPLVHKFLSARGYRIARDEPAIGLLETDWKDRFTDTQSDGAPTWRERLRARIEPAIRPGSAEIYLSQQSSEHVTGTESDSPWQLRSPDEERAIEMLNRLARFLAAEEVQDAVALDPLDARLGNDDDDGLALIVAAPFDMVWRRTGIALEALGFTIEDYNRANRLYRVYSEMSSGLTKGDLKYGKPRSATVRENFHIKLQEEDDRVLITIRGKDGRVESSSIARDLLTLLRGEFQ